MPWLETDRVNERKRLVVESWAGPFSHSGLRHQHGISRKTGCEWLERYQVEGPDGLEGRSHKPLTCSHATPPEVL